MKTSSRLVLLVSAFILAGCAAPQERKEQLVDRNGIDVVGAPADRQEVVIKDAVSHERYCTPPAPDVALTSESGAGVGLKAAVVPAGTELSHTSGIGALTLGGRSPAVLLARELLYRACELNINLENDQRTATAVFKMTMDAVERIAALQTGSGGAAVAAAPPPASSGLPSDFDSIFQSSAPATTAAPAANVASDSGDNGSSGSSSGSSTASTPQQGW